MIEISEPWKSCTHIPSVTVDLTTSTATFNVGGWCPTCGSLFDKKREEWVYPHCATEVKVK